MPFAILLKSPPPHAKEREPEFIRTKTMAKAGYPRLKELVNSAISTSEKKCIIWKCNSKRPYPQLKVTDNRIGIDKETTFTHRAVAQYVLERKLIYNEKRKEVVDHHCGEKKCINPYHLFVMSPVENNGKKHWLRMSDNDRLIIVAWLKAPNYSNQKKNQLRHSAIKFLEFMKNYLNIEDALKRLHTKSSEEINNIVHEWKTYLLKKVQEKLLTYSTVSGHLSYVKNLLKFVKRPDLLEILQREKESEVKQLNVVDQAKKELTKKRVALKHQGITDEAQLTALLTECNECKELRKEIKRVKDENEFLCSKLVEKDLEIERYKLIQLEKNYT